MLLPFEVTCEKCHTKIFISENEMGIVGGKDKETAICPNPDCKAIVYEGMTNGFWETNFFNLTPL